MELHEIVLDLQEIYISCDVAQLTLFGVFHAVFFCLKQDLLQSCLYCLNMPSGLKTNFLHILHIHSYVESALFAVGEVLLQHAMLRRLYELLKPV